MRAKAAVIRNFLELFFNNVTETKTIRDLILDQIFAVADKSKDGSAIQATSAHGTSITYMAYAQSEGLNLSDLHEIYDYLKQLYDRAAVTFGESEFTQEEIKNKMMSAIVAKKQWVASYNQMQL